MKNGLVEWKGVKVETLRRLGISLLTALVIFLFCIFAPPQTELFDKIGMELAVLVIALFLCRFPIGTYLMVNLFLIFPAAGSILKLYDRFPGYDRVVHYISGLLLGAIGIYLIEWIFKRLSLPHEPFVVILFGGFFSFAGAGFWEIIEFLTDCILHMGVQHGNTDTMGDIVAGYLGSVSFQLFKCFEYRKYFSRERIRNFFKGQPASTDSDPNPAAAQGISAEHETATAER